MFIRKVLRLTELGELKDNLHKNEYLFQLIDKSVEIDLTKTIMNKPNETELSKTKENTR